MYLHAYLHTFIPAKLSQTHLVSVNNACASELNDVPCIRAKRCP